MLSTNRLWKSNRRGAAGCIMLALLALSLFASHRAIAAPLIVTSSADSGAGSLRQAVLDASDGDTIGFAGSISSPITLTSGEIAITKNLAINGPGAGFLTISGNNASSIFQISGAIVSISELTLNGGAGGGKGGGAIFNAGDLTLSNCILSGNNGSTGGGILNQNTLTVNNSAFVNNHVTGNGGAITNYSMLTVNTSTFSGNSAGYFGGGIYSFGHAMVSGSVFTGSSARSGGGAIWNENQDLSITFSSLSGNSAFFGGGIASKYGTLTVNSCTLSGNSAADGGGISSGYYPGDNAINSGKLTLSSSTLSGNSSTSSGGGIRNNAVATISSSTIASNGTGGGSNPGGGGIYNLGAMTVTNTILALNTVLAGGTGPDAAGPITSGDYNLVQDTTGATITGAVTHNIYGQDPGLGPLQDNGGPTFTLALLPGSPAIDAGSCGGATSDQRGKARPIDVPGIPNSDDGCDIGAFEFGNWQGIDLAVGSDSRARILWSFTDGSIEVWSVDTTGAATFGPVYGPYNGYTAGSIAAGADGLIRILWHRTDGAAALWIMGPDNTYRASFGYGPYAGWTATDLAVGSDGKTRILWTHTSGAMAVWTVDNSGNASYGPIYGPYSGFTARRIAAGGDGLTRVSWFNESQSTGVLWLMNPNNTFATGLPPGGLYGPYIPGGGAAWTLPDLAVSTDNQARLLWTNPNGQMAVWSVDNSDHRQYGPIYGPYPGFTATHIAAGPGGLTWVMWNQANGILALWLMGQSGPYNNIYETSFGFGPY